MKTTSLLVSFLCTIGIIATPLKRRPAIRPLYTFPNGTFVENLHARQNGHLIITTLTSNELYTLDPTARSPTPKVIHTFPNGTALTGLTEIKRDIFAVITGIFDLSLGAAALGSLTICTVSLRDETPGVKKITSIANSTLFNGVASIPEDPYIILAADSHLGAVWKVDLRTGAYDVAFADPLFETRPDLPLSGANLGIDGIKIWDKYLYWANSIHNQIGRVKINEKGEKIGPLEVVATIENTVEIDDLDFDSYGDIWITSPVVGKVVWLSADGKQQRIVDDSSVVAGATSVAFGRSLTDLNTAYVGTYGTRSDAGFARGGIGVIDTSRV
jgi:hypothetical protein